MCFHLHITIRNTPHKHAHTKILGPFLPKGEDVGVGAVLVSVICCEFWREGVPCVVVVIAGGWEGSVAKGADHFWW